MILWLDIETFADVPIKNGVHRYAERAEVLLYAWAVDDGPVQVGEADTGGVVANLIERAELVVIHNSAFDRTVLRHQGVVIPIGKVWDTLAQARAHSLPGALGTLCDALGVPVDKAKDKAGKQLIQLFCKPRPKSAKLDRATKDTHPVEWARFREYAALDVEAMREVYKRLPTWNYIGAERALWELDQRINERGFAVDLDLAHAAIDAVAREQTRLRGRVTEMTDGEVTAATQRDAMLRHLLAEYGVELPDFQKGTLERRVNDPDLPEPVRELLAIRLESATTSTAKYQKLVDCVSSDGRLRGTLEFCGASRTGRWAGRLFQPQNLPRPVLDRVDIEPVIAAIKSGVADMVYADPTVMALCSSALRGAIVAPPGHKLVCVDLSNIEGRVLAWLAGEKWKLDAFRAFDAGTGPDLYLAAAGSILGKRPEDVTKEERQISGKVPELACGFGGAVGAFTTWSRLYGMDIVEDEVVAIVKAWRRANKEIVSFWYDLERRAKEAVTTPGCTVRFGRLLLRRDGAWLRIGLPSGRALCYPSPRIDDGVLSYMGMDQYTRKWERIDTYSGKLCIAAGTKVLTQRGWTPIESITAADVVWDGVSWVQTGGCVYKGRASVLKAHGVWMTPDHRVLTKKGWVRASQSERFDRAPCRLPDSRGIRWFRWASIALGDAVRVRRLGASCGERDGKTAKARNTRFVRMSSKAVYRSSAHHTRHDIPSGVLGMAEHDRSLFAANPPGLAQLRRSRNYCVRAVAGIVRGFLGGHGSYLPAGADAGSRKQRRGLLSRQLPMGDVQTAGGEPSPERALVYDLLDCGPRHRFVVADENGEPLIVHNCENVTQAVARDVLAAAMPVAEAAGYQVVLTVHDDLVTAAPDNPAFGVDQLAAILARNPPWADGLPLAAVGFEGYRYGK